MSWVKFKNDNFLLCNEMVIDLSIASQILLNIQLFYVYLLFFFLWSCVALMFIIKVILGSTCTKMRLQFKRYNSHP